jgi:outer membrane biosynthesis protein TonB
LGRSLIAVGGEEEVRAVMDDETRTRRKLTSEFRRMDDELAASVALPAVDSVIRRAGTTSRATTAAAAAVFTVGSLGGITAVAQASTPRDPAPAEVVSGPPPAAALVPAPAPGPSIGERERAAQVPTTAAAAARPTVVVKPKVTVKPKPKPKPTVVQPKPTAKPKPKAAVAAPADDGNDEGKADPAPKKATPNGSGLLGN